jgi:hypothetical protein
MSLRTMRSEIKLFEISRTAQKSQAKSYVRNLQLFSFWTSISLRLVLKI